MVFQQTKFFTISCFLKSETAVYSRKLPFNFWFCDFFIPFILDLDLNLVLEHEPISRLYLTPAGGRPPPSSSRGLAANAIPRRRKTAVCSLVPEALDCVFPLWGKFGAKRLATGTELAIHPSIKCSPPLPFLWQSPELGGKPGTVAPHRCLYRLSQIGLLSWQSGYYQQRWYWQAPRSRRLTIPDRSKLRWPFPVSRS